MIFYIKYIKSKTTGKTYPCLCNDKRRIITFDPYTLSALAGVRYTELKELDAADIKLEVSNV